MIWCEMRIKEVDDQGRYFELFAQITWNSSAQTKLVVTLTQVNYAITKHKEGE